MWVKLRGKCRSLSFMFECVLVIQKTITAKVVRIKWQMKTKLSILGEKSTKYATELWHSNHSAIFFQEGNLIERLLLRTQGKCRKCQQINTLRNSTSVCKIKKKRAKETQQWLGNVVKLLSRHNLYKTKQQWHVHVHEYTLLHRRTGCPKYEHM